VQHNPNEAMPRVGTLYRCPVCRLELDVDPDTHKMRVAPLDRAADHPPAKSRRKHS
jgi:hypothetical protein